MNFFVYLANILSIMNKYSVYKVPNDILLETAEKHRALRKSLKMSQAELAQRSGVSLGSIKRFEQTGQIAYLSLLKLAHILHRLSEFESIFEQKEDLGKIELLFSDKMREQ